MLSIVMGAIILGLIAMIVYRAFRMKPNAQTTAKPNTQTTTEDDAQTTTEDDAQTTTEDDAQTTTEDDAQTTAKRQIVMSLVIWTTFVGVLVGAVIASHFIVDSLADSLQELLPQQLPTDTRLMVNIWTAFSAIIAFSIFALTIYKGWYQVPQKDEWIIEVFGAYSTTWEPGLHILFPYFGWMEIASKVYMGEQQIALFMNEAIKEGYGGSSVDFKDASAPVNAIIYLVVINSYKATYNVGDLFPAIERKLESALRAFYSKKILDEANETKIRNEFVAIMNGDPGSTDNDPALLDGKFPLYKSIRIRWGTEITAFAVTDILMPTSVLGLREKILAASKDAEAAVHLRKAKIITANGERRATILQAQGNKESLELTGEGLLAQYQKLRNAGMSEEHAILHLSEQLKWPALGDKAVYLQGGDAMNLGANLGIGMRATSNTNATNQGS